MKQLQKSDLKEGEIYKQLEFDYIFLYNKNETYNSFNDGTAISTYAPRYYKRWSGNDFKKPMIEATPEEKHWLETCIKADKFVSYEEAMKTFVPEYVECTLSKSDSYKLNKIYKVIKNTEYVESKTGFWKAKWNNNSIVQSKFKPSTKEAYDAQFVVKEPEFEEPKYDILVSKENKYISVQCPEGGVYKIGDKITVFDKTSPNKGKPFTIKSFRWSNDKSKICAITELHTPNGISIDKIELCVEPKVESKIVEDFVLPEKWCVEVNDEIRNKIGYCEVCGYHHSIQINNINKWSYNIKEGFTEITFEQFKKYVLKDE